MALAQAGITRVASCDVNNSVMTDEEGAVDGRSGVESTTSEISWEALDEGEARPTLWVPDHAATACMGCNTQFWFGRRKHHCRSCGKLFCAECSEKYLPIPSEQLYPPVRVCDLCFQELDEVTEGVENAKEICDKEQKEEALVEVNKECEKIESGGKEEKMENG